MNPKIKAAILQDVRNAAKAARGKPDRVDQAITSPWRMEWHRDRPSTLKLWKGDAYFGEITWNPEQDGVGPPTWISEILWERDHAVNLATFHREPKRQGARGARARKAASKLTKAAKLEERDNLLCKITEALKGKGVKDFRTRAIAALAKSRPGDPDYKIGTTDFHRIVNCTKR